MLRTSLAGVTLGFLALATSAAAAGPPNDNRANATPISRPPVTVSGNTNGSTKETSDPGSYCGTADGTLWYRLSGADAGRLVLRLSAEGDLDGYVAVFKV